MAGAWTTITILDSTGATKTMRVWSENSTTGPYSFGQVLTAGDGTTLVGADPTHGLKVQSFIDPTSVNANGRNTPANSAPVVEASRTYQDVAASATATVLGSTGATGDWLEGILVVPETTSAGTVALLDLATSVNIFVSGTLPSLVPFYVPMGCASKNGAWKITTGTAVHIRAFGNFT